MARLWAPRRTRVDPFLAFVIVLKWENSMTVPTTATPPTEPSSELPSRSALLVAACRMLADELPESERLISDPFAREFADAEAIAAARADRPLQRSIRLRTRYIDDRVREFCAARASPQVLVLGAGLDARSYRLGLEVPFFEVDFPASVAHKQRVLDRLGAVCARRRTIGVDLRRERFDAPLCNAGFDAREATCVIWEGVVHYLSAKEVASVLAQLSALLAAGSWLVADYVSSAASSDLERARTRGIAESLRAGGEGLRTGPRDFAGALAAHGFELVDDEAIEELAPRYGLAVGERHYPARIALARRR